MKSKNILIVSAFILVILGGFYFLNSNSSTNQNQGTSESNVIKVGMSGSYKPYTYLNDKGELTGFDVDVWKEIGKRIGYEVEFVTSDFSGLFGMLDSNQIDTIANQITVTEAREEKYLFTRPYVYYGAQLISKSDRDDIVDLESLKGKSVAVGLGTNYEEMIREFDKDSEIEIITYDSGSGSYQDVAIGRVDAAMNDRLALQSVIKESGLPLKLAGGPLNELHNAFPFLNTTENKELIEKIDQAIDSMYEDNTIKNISEKYFDIDISERF